MNGFKKIMAVIMIIVLFFSFNTQILNAVSVDEIDNSDMAAPNKVYQDYNYSDNNFEKATENIDLDAENRISGGTLIKDSNAFKLEKGDAIEFSVNITKNAAYNIALSFSPLDEITENYKISLKIDGKTPFSECEELILRTLWEDDGEIRTLTNGDQVSPLQKHKDGFYIQKFVDDEGIQLYPYEFMLSEGKHTIRIEILSKELLIDKVCLLAPEVIKPYSEVLKDYSKYEKYTGPQIVIEAEKTAYKTLILYHRKATRALRAFHLQVQ